MASIGIDLGTFHTLAVAVDRGNVLIPSSTVPSIALLGGPTPIVGLDAVQQLDLGRRLLQAPKLMLGREAEDAETLSEVMRKLAQQALTSIDVAPGSRVVITVPPRWDLARCDLLVAALATVGSERLFLHEPIALLIAAWYLAPRHRDPTFRAKLGSFREILVCDWGAGTVDLALVSCVGPFDRPTFQCRADATLVDWGGTSIARSSVAALRAAGGGIGLDPELAALLLQQHWAGAAASPVPLEDLHPFVLRGRQDAAIGVRCAVERVLLDRSTTDTLCVMHGGPLESEELRSEFSRALAQLGISEDRQIHVGNEFCHQVADGPAHLRRESLVALGGALYLEHGRPLPEFQYEVALRDAMGRTGSSVTLAVSPTLRGVQVIEPPFTGVDYSVEVRQQRTLEAGGVAPTGIAKELALHVRENAVLCYKIGAAGVGFARIEAQENRGGITVPRPYDDSRIAFVTMPESSTRFTLDLVPTVPQ